MGSLFLLTASYAFILIVVPVWCACRVAKQRFN
jgi:hypothetical protein